jgi:hypothetical protein
MSWIDKIEARLKAATPGPLLYRSKSSSFHKKSETHPFGEYCIEIREDDDGRAKISEGDIELVENASADLRKLLARVKELESNLAVAVEALEVISSGCLVPPDGGSPSLDDAITEARAALAKIRGKE